MKKEYLHLSVYPCDQCEGPVVSGSFATRQNEISKETDRREAGAICLSCGHRQSGPMEGTFTRDFAPAEWTPVRRRDSVEIARPVDPGPPRPDRTVEPAVPLSSLP